MTRKTRNWITAGFVLVVVLFLRALIPWPLYYKQDAIKAQVVDSVTGAPIRDAAVVAVWQETRGGWERTWSTYRFDETTTNERGFFEIKGWGPKWRHWGEGRLTDDDPDLYIYTPGYQLRYVNNRSAYVEVTGRQGMLGHTIWVPLHTPGAGQVAEKYPGWRWGGAKRYCFWNGKTIGMERTKSPEEDAQVLKNLAHAIQGDVAQRDKLPTFWQRWHRGWVLLPEPLRSTVYEGP